MDPKDLPGSTTTTETPTETPPRGPLTDAELQADHPAVAVLVAKLESVVENALYDDPRRSIKSVAAALVEYFRTPDAP